MNHGWVVAHQLAHVLGAGQRADHPGGEQRRRRLRLTIGRLRLTIAGAQALEHRLAAEVGTGAARNAMSMRRRGCPNRWQPLANGGHGASMTAVSLTSHRRPRLAAPAPPRAPPPSAPTRCAPRAPPPARPRTARSAPGGRRGAGRSPPAANQVQQLSAPAPTPTPTRPDEGMLLSGGGCRNHWHSLAKRNHGASIIGTHRRDAVCVQEVGREPRRRREQHVVDSAIREHAERPLRQRVHRQARVLALGAQSLRLSMHVFRRTNVT
jgi:hypothetical protein